MSQAMFKAVCVSCCLLVLLSTCDSYSYPQRPSVSSNLRFNTRIGHGAFALRADNNDLNDTNEGLVSPQIARMKAAAAKLRLEAAELEVVQKEDNLQSLSAVFKTFDRDNDGSISIEELREGLEKELQASVSVEQAMKVMKMFDSSGDGSLQIDEFPMRGVETFQNKLYNILQDERKEAADAQSEARMAKDESEQMERILEMINNQPPTNTDKLLSLLPYLLPLLDALPYGGKLIDSWNPEPNPLLLGLGVLYQLYGTIPFSGLILFFAFNAVSNNLQLNRLVRFNIQQAIFIDISLIIPGIIGSIVEIVVLQTSGSPVPTTVEQAGSAATFLAVAAAIGYSCISTLAGQEPDKIPLISSRVKDRVPTTEQFQIMLKEGMDQMKDKDNGSAGPKAGEKKEADKDKDDKDTDKDGDTKE